MRKKTIKLQQKTLSYSLGNLFILFSLLLFLVVFFPVIKAYVSPPNIKTEQELKGNYITVPKIHAQAPLYFNIDPYNETLYRNVLKKGVAQAKGSSLPGQKGSVFIFAHSSGNPFEVTRFNTIFLRLGELKKNDEILIKKDNRIYKYLVIETKVVWPTETKYLKQTKDQLIVQTCWPIGTSFKRLLVFAKPIN